MGVRRVRLKNAKPWPVLLKEHQKSNITFRASIYYNIKKYLE
jgi:hypothetical protein